MARWFRIVLVTTLISSLVSTAFVLALPRLAPSWFLIRSPAAQVSPAVPDPAGTAQTAQTRTASLPGTAQTPQTGNASPPIRPAGGPSDSEPWWARLIGKIAWPAGLILGLLLIAWNSRLRRLFGAGSRLVRRINAGGVEMEISSESVDEVRQQLRGSFRELVGNARDEYERMADLQDIDLRLAAVVEKEIVPGLGGVRPAGLRATIHVRDIVFKDYLYQLVNYHPNGGGAHRRFSQRYGIIGRAWRTGVSHGTGNAFGSTASEESLVEEWGMTREETHGVLNSRPSCLSVLLRAGGIDVGILYIDSSAKRAFGTNDEASTYSLALEQKPLVVELAAAVERALAPLRAAGPNLDLKELG
jgi:hypothetical protein